MHRPHLHIGLLIFIFISIFLWGQGIVFAETRVRVGIFQNEPMSFMSETGEARGIYPDVIREIAQKENWEIEFIPDSWAGCLNRLESGKIDLMISIVRTSDRETRYDFTKIPVLTAWGQVYAKADHGISNILNLEAKTIGIMEKDINGKHFQDLARNFKINCNYKTFIGYDDLCKALLSAKVDAVVMNNVSGASFQRKYQLQPTAILFSPIDTFFAVNKGKNTPFLRAIDQWVGTWQKDKNSVYYTILSKWYGNLSTFHGASLKWIIGIACLIVGLALFLFVWNRILGLQVKLHTRKLRTSEEKYRTLSQKALVGIYQITHEGEIIFANLRMARIFGYDSEEDFLKTNKNLSSLFADPGKFNSLILEIDKSGSVEGKLIEFLSGDSHRIWGNLHIRRTDGNGSAPVYDGFLEDISQRYRHEQLLRSRLRLNQNSSTKTTSQLLQIFLDEAEMLTRSTIGFFHFLSKDQTTILLQTWSSNTLEQMCKTIPEERHYPVDRAGVWADCIKSHGPVIHNDYTALHHRKGIPKGHAPVIREMVVPVIRANRIMAILGVGNKPSDYGQADLDIVRELADTAWEIVLKKQAEEELQLTQKRLLAILNGIESTIYVADMNTHEILFMNDYMKELFGADHTGETCWKAFRHQEGPCAHCTNQFLVDQDFVPTGIHLSEDRHPVTGRWNIYHDRAIKWVDGRVARLQVASDVTKLKEMEHQQLDYENKIRQAQKMEALGALASGIAHDFNNILFPILGYAELLGEDISQDSPHRKGLDEIMAGARRARDLVDQILTFSRQTEHAVAPLRPDLVVKEVIKLMRSTLPSTIRINKYVAKDCKMILADPTQLHQVAMNLVTNAFHAMENDGGTLTVRLDNADGRENDLQHPGPHIRLTVGDTGIGIDEKTIEKIFDPYFTTKPKGKGTGLGLSVVHGIVKKYKGEIKISSGTGQGSQFDVFIPAVDRTKKQEITGTEPTPAGGAERILLVDDEPQVLKLEREILERMGYKVEIEASSKNALDLVRKTPDMFDLVISDMTMPEMTGDLLTQEIRKIAPHIPVIICTGFSERINRERQENLGVKKVLLKPVNKSDLTKTVREVLDAT